MTGRIIPLRGDHHQEALCLLPWYATGQLDAADGALVEAHLAGCAKCQAELKLERRLRAEVARLPIEVGQGWAMLRRRIAADAPARRRAHGVPAWIGEALGRARSQWSAGAPWLRWSLAAQVALILLLAAFVLPIRPAARYHALGSAPAPASGNVVVLFRPDASEADLRRLLQAADARLVDGPTAAGAYVLHVPSAERAAALVDLRARAQVELAQPVDSAGPP